MRWWWSRRQPAASSRSTPIEVDPWSDRIPVAQLSPADAWTIGDASEGLQIFGATGSGKTSGSGAAIARQFLRLGYGGIVLCAKREERALWQTYAKHTGRQESVVVFDAAGRHRFNPLDYELRRPGEGAGLTTNIAELLTTVLEVAEGDSRERGQDFWCQAPIFSASIIQTKNYLELW